VRDPLLFHCLENLSGVHDRPDSIWLHRPPPGRHPAPNEHSSEQAMRGAPICATGAVCVGTTSATKTLRYLIVADAFLRGGQASL
jgi:hypothetical protein